MTAARSMLTTLMVALLAGAPAAAQTIDDLRRQVAESPTSVQAKEALAEAYLRACELEKSLAVWRQVLRQAPDHGRARQVVERLTLQKLDLDSHLAILASLIDRGAVDGLGAMLDAAAERAANDEQKAMVLYLRGRLAQAARARLEEQARPWRSGGEIALPPPAGEEDEAESRPARPAATAEPAGPPMPAAARTSYMTALGLWPNTTGGARSAMALAAAEEPAEAGRLLRAVAGNMNLADAGVQEQAQVRLLLLNTASLPAGERTAALKELSGRLKTAEGRREALRALLRLALAARPAAVWTPDAVSAAAAIVATGPPFDEANRMMDRLLAVARDSQDPRVLEALLAARLPEALEEVSLRHKALLVETEAAFSRAVVADDADEMKRYLALGRQTLDRLRAPGNPALFPKQMRAAGNRSLLVEAQKLIAFGRRTEALPVLLKAKDGYLAQMAHDPAGGVAELGRTARLLDEIHEWEMAVWLYREIAARFAHLPAGREALWQAAQLTDRRLGAPLAALEIYAEYASRYPAELPYRQLSVGHRLGRLGFANVLDLQKRTGLKPDGIFGPSTRRKLEEFEESFDAIAWREGGPGVLRGRFVHPAILAIARRLEAAGRHHDAIGAYRMFLNLFPPKKDADDALIAVARLFRDNLLFEEAIGAYRQLMEDFPKGDMTSPGYIEAAGCLENLGRWDEAKALYELYIKKFPRYEHVALCRSRLELMQEIQQYQDFIADNPDSPKLPEARYQIAVILYEKLKNNTKAAVEFAAVAGKHPKHVRAADGLFTAGAAHLREENFPAARNVFAQLVQAYPDSRLADDAQYWIGHTHEYAARALGRLDAARIVLRRRSLSARSKLLADMALRRRYFPGAKPGPEMPEDVWGGDTLGVLASGSRRDRVNADLFRAITAYRVVVDKFRMGDMAGNALLRIGTIYTQYLKDPDKGIEAYQELLAHYPGSAEAVDALYAVGEYHLEKKAYDKAIEAFQKFIYNYPREAKVEPAMIAIARCHVATKAWDKALDAYQRYLNKFPDGRLAESAKAQIAWIRMYHF